MVFEQNLGLERDTHHLPITPSSADIKRGVTKQISISWPREFRIDGGRMSFSINQDSRWGELFLPSEIFPVKEISLLADTEFSQERTKRPIENLKAILPDKLRGVSIYNMYDSSQGRLMMNVDAIYKMSQQQVSNGQYPYFLENYGYGREKIPSANELFSLYITEQVLQLAALTRLSKMQAFIRKNPAVVFLDSAIGGVLILAGEPYGIGLTAIGASAYLGTDFVKSNQLFYQFLQDYRDNVVKGTDKMKNKVKLSIPRKLGKQVDLAPATSADLVKKEKDNKPLGLFVQVTGSI